MREEAPGRDRLPLLTRRHFFIGAAFAATSAVAFARQPKVHMPLIDQEGFEGWVPGRFGEWEMLASSGVVLPPPDELSDRLYDNLVTRIYLGLSDVPVMVLLAYNNRQDGVLQVHRPEVCYPVGGYAITRSRPVSAVGVGDELPANFFTATGRGRIEQVMYFTRLGDAYPRTWAEQRVAVIQENLAGRIPDGIMLRVSTLGPDPTEALELLQAFVAKFLQAVSPPLRELLVG